LKHYFPVEVAGPAAQRRLRERDDHALRIASPWVPRADDGRHWPCAGVRHHKIERHSLADSHAVRHHYRSDRDIEGRSGLSLRGRGAPRVYPQEREREDRDDPQQDGLALTDAKKHLLPFRVEGTKK